MTAQTIIRNTIAEQVYAELRGWMASGRLQPGERLRPDEIAGVLNVSQTPVKEALVRLGAEGLVETAPRRGTVVRRLSRAHTAELFAVREMIESWAIRDGLAAGRVTPEFLDRIRETVDDLCKAVDGGRFIDQAGAMEADRRMHYLLVGLSDNRLMTDWYRQVISQTEFIRLYATAPERAIETQMEHKAILAALETRDLDVILATVHDHFESACGGLLQTIDEEPAATS